MDCIRNVCQDVERHKDRKLLEQAVRDCFLPVDIAAAVAAAAAAAVAVHEE